MRRFLIVFVSASLVAGPAGAAPPSNDDAAHAVVVSSFPATIEADTSEATTGLNEEGCSGAGLFVVGVRQPVRAVWYRLDFPEEAQRFRVLYGEAVASVVLWYAMGTTPSGDPILSRDGCVYPDDSYPHSVGPDMYMSVGAPLSSDVPSFSILVEIVEDVPVSNDLSYRATNIPSLPYETRQDAGAANYDHDPQGCPQGAYVWYTYTPTAAETIEISVSAQGMYSGGGATVAAYSLGDEVHTLGCDGGRYNTASVVTPAEVGIPVLIGIGPDGILTLGVHSLGGSGPSTDARADAFPLTVGRTMSYDTTGATLEPGEPTTCGAGGSVWFGLPPRARAVEVVFSGAVSVAAVDGDTVLDCSDSGTLALPAGSRATHLQVRSSTAATGTVALRYASAYGDQITDVSPFPGGCGDQSDPPYVNSEVEVSQAVDPHDPDHLVVTWQQDRYPDRGGARGIGAATSFDGGTTWTNSTIPGVSVCSGGTFQRATDPWAAIDADGTAYVMSLGYDPGENEQTNLKNTVLINRSEDGGRTWGEPIVVAVSPGILFHDKEALTADLNTPGLLYAVWDIYPTNEAFPVFSRSEDGGRTWTPPVPLPTTGPGAGDQIAVLDDGTLVEIASRSSMQSITSHDRGRTWSTVSEFAYATPGQEGPPGVRGGAYIPSVSTDGHSVFVTWSDTYSTFFARSDNAGTTWMLKEVGGGRYVYPRRFTTAVARAGTGRLAVMTYMIDESFQAWIALATSSDGGRTWSEKPITETFDMQRAPLSSGRGYFLGDYFGLSAAGDNVIAAFAVVPPGSDEGVSNVYSLRLTP